MRKRLSLALFGLGFALLARADEGAVFFTTGSTQLDGKSEATVRRIAHQAAHGAVFHLAGSTDPRGSEELNSRLRSERVASVKQALVAAGVSESQIQIDDAPAGMPRVDSRAFWRMRRVGIHFDSAEEAGAENKAPEKAPVAENKAPEKAPVAENKAPEKAPAAESKAPEKAPAAENKAPEKAPADKAAADKQQPKVAVGPDGKPLETIRLIYWKTLNHALWIIAKDKGFFAQEGFDVKLQETNDDARVLAHQLTNDLAGGQGAMTTKALQAGQRKFFAGAICGYAAHEAMAKGEQVVDIGSMVMITETLVMPTALAQKIDKDIHPFKRNNIGDLTYGAGEHDFKYTNVLRGELEKVGLQDKKDYSVTEYPDWDKLYADLLAKKVDIAKGLPPGDVEFVHSHPEFTRVPLVKFFPYVPCCRQLITRQQLRDSRDKYVRLLRASIRAHEFTIEHPKEAAEILARELKVPASVIREAVMSSYISLTPDPMRKGVELYQRTNDRYTNTKTHTAEYMDTSLYRDALLSLAKENQADASQKKYFDTMIARFKQND